MIFHAQLLILTVKFLRYCRKEIDLERKIKRKDEVMPDSRTALPRRAVQSKKPTEQLDAMRRKGPEV